MVLRPVVFEPGSSDQCVLAQVKSNLGPVASSLTYRTADCHSQPTIEWSGECGLTPDELVFLAGRSGDGALGEAINVLFAWLGDGPVSARRVQELAAEEGVSRATLKRAKCALGVISRRRGFGPGSTFRWELDEENSLVRHLRSVEAERVMDQLLYGEDNDDDPADGWKPGPS